MFSKKVFMLVWVLLLSLPAMALIQDSVLTVRSIKHPEKVKILPKDKTYVFHLTSGEKYKGKYQIIDEQTVKIIGKHDEHSIKINDIKQINSLSIGWKISGAIFTIFGGFFGYYALAFFLSTQNTNINNLGEIILLVLILALAIILAVIAGILFLIGIPMFFIGHRYRSKRWKFEITPES